jgi:RNA polymerase sigma-70 factor (ECF subfamily)
MTDFGVEPTASDASLNELTSDFELLMRVQVRDEAALAALYERFGGLLFTLALRIVGDRGAAQEVMQDTFLRCWDRAERYDPARASVAAWLIAVTRNRAIDVLRGRVHQARLRETEILPGSDSPGEPWEADSSEAAATQQVVRAALGELSPPQRQVIELAYYAGLTQSEIARRLGEPLGTVKDRMRTGMAKLRNHLIPNETGSHREALHDQGN